MDEFGRPPRPQDRQAKYEQPELERRLTVLSANLASLFPRTKSTDDAKGAQGKPRPFSLFSYDAIFVDKKYRIPKKTKTRTTTETESENQEKKGTIIMDEFGRPLRPQDRQAKYEQPVLEHRLAVLSANLASLFPLTKSTDDAKGAQEKPRPFSLFSYDIIDQEAFQKSISKIEATNWQQWHDTSRVKGTPVEEKGVEFRRVTSIDGIST